MGPTAGTTVLLGAVAAVAAVLAVLFLILWVAAVRRARRVRRAALDAESTAAQLQLAVADQGGRLRIVHELHDVAVGRVAAIVARADAAHYAGATDPGAAVRAADEIAELGRATLADLRRVVTLVQETPGDSAPPELAQVVDAMREAGLDPVLEQNGTPFALEAGAQVAVTRILQEALQHALDAGGEGTAVRVAITWTENGVALRVDDASRRNRAEQRFDDPDAVRAELAYTADEDHRALTQEMAGPGVAEMRARAELYGGTLAITDVPGVGVSVSASFPTIRFHNGVHGVDLR